MYWNAIQHHSFKKKSQEPMCNFDFGIWGAVAEMPVK